MSIGVINVSRFFMVLYLVCSLSLAVVQPVLLTGSTGVVLEWHSELRGLSIAVLGDTVVIEDWPTYMHDVNNTGYIVSAAPLVNTSVWSYAMGTPIGYSVGESAAAVADGRVYVGGMDGRLYCLDAVNGQEVWNVSLGVTIRSSPAVVGDRVYVGADDQLVYCFDISNGQQIWNYTTDDNVGSSPTVVDDRLYIGSWDDHVYCLNVSNGSHIWNYTTGGDVEAAPAVVDGLVYAGSMDQEVYCLNATDGVLVWNYTCDFINGSVSVVDGYAYVGSYDSQVRCFDASNGSLIWNQTLGWWVHATPAVAYGRVLVGSMDGTFYCLDAVNGSIIWSFASAGGFLASAAIAHWTVVVGSSGGHIHAINISSGASIWNYTTGVVYMSTALWNGLAIVGDEDGIIYAIGDLALPISDLTWGVTPSDHVHEFGSDYSYQLSVTSSNPIDHWWVNDSTHFMIDSSGVLRNATLLTVGKYGLLVRVNDTLGTVLSAEFRVDVQDRTPPSWSQTPENQVIQIDRPFLYDLNATDLSALDTWWINDTDYFSIDLEGVITNATMLLLGYYPLLVNVNDNYGNVQSAAFSVTVNPDLGPPDFDIGALIRGVVVLVAISIPVVVVLLRKPTK